MDAAGHWEIDPVGRELRIRGRVVPIGGRAFEILEALVQATGEIVSKNELMKRIWPGAIVEENTLHVHISAIRKALGPDRAILKTASGRGYRLLGKWTPATEPSDTDRESRVAARPSSAWVHGNLRTPASDLIGRATVLQQVRDLTSAYRLVTLTGPGGIGKTRVALQTARMLSPEFQGDVWWVELASLSDAGLIAVVIAGALGLSLVGPDISADALARAIGARKLLLVIDNCEHLIAGAAEAIETVIRWCPSVTVLATSRELLRLEGEYTYRIPPLDLASPDGPAGGQEGAGKSGAVQLFLAGMTAYHAGSALPGADDLAAIAAICRRLDGIPLAIELAAARAATLGIRQVLGHLDDRFALLTSGRRTALPKDRTLRATLDWSYQLLNDRQKSLLTRLAIFAGAFTLEGAIAVTGRSAAAAQTADGIADLVEKSLVTKDLNGAAAELRLLETTRLYAREKLAGSDTLEEVCRRHADYFLALLRKVGEVRKDSSPSEHRAALWHVANEVHAALDWAYSAPGDTALAVALTIAAIPMWFDLSRIMDVRAFSEQALHHAGVGSNDEMHLQLALGHALWYLAPSDGTLTASIGRALEIAESRDDVPVQAQALWGQWAAHRGRAAFGAALEAANQYCEMAKRAADPALLHLGDRILGLTHHLLGDQTRARHFAESALRKPRHLGLVPNVGFQVETPIAIGALQARILWLQGFPDQAAVVAQQAIDDAQQEGHAFSVHYALYFGGVPLALWTGELDEAERRLAMLTTFGSGRSREGMMIRCFGRLIHLRRGNAREALIASYVEPRLDLSSFAAMADLVREQDIPTPVPVADHGKVAWNTPELLRVDAELMLYDQPGLADRAEANLLRCLDIARRQSALSWELRGAMSLARLWRRLRRQGEAHSLLAATYGKFSEGHDTDDLLGARALLAEIG